MGSLQSLSMPAYPKMIPVNVKDGFVYIRLYGDEHYKRAETSDGHTILQKDELWYYAEKDDNGFLVPSEYPIQAFPDSGTVRFLKMTPIHLEPDDNIKKAAIKRRESSASNRQKATGIRKMLVILMQYKDVPFHKSKTDFDNLFNQKNYAEDGAKGSVYDFYTDVSYGQLQLQIDVIGPCTTKYNKSYYGKNNRYGSDSNTEDLFTEAVKYAVTQCSLSDYDSDADGFVDNIHIVFAGYGEEAGAEQNAIWSHEATFYTPYEAQGMKIDRYSCAPELRGKSGTGISRIGPHCHEIGHALGAMDFYDTNYEEDGYYNGTGEWDIMAEGSWNNNGITPADFNPYVKSANFEWINPQPLPKGCVTLMPSCFDADSYYYIQSSDAEDYYLLEHRTKSKWGEGLPGEGLLFYHVHGDIASVGNEINVTAPQRCYIVCASQSSRLPGNSSTSYGNINSPGCPYPGSSMNRTFGQGSIPTPFFWDSDYCGIEINDITIDTNGNVHLTNNSVGTVEDDVKIEKIFFEGFEESLQIQQTEEIGTTPWVVEEIPSNVKIFDKIRAFEGNKSLQLSARQSLQDIRGTFDFKCLPSSSFVALTIKYHVASRYVSPNAPNVIRLYYREKDNEDWHFFESQSTKNGIWEQQIINLQDNTAAEFKIEGIVQAESILAVDNIEISQKILNEGSLSQIRQIPCCPEDDKVFVYTITGVFIGSMRMNESSMLCLPKGTYIIRGINGISTKRIIE